MVVFPVLWLFSRADPAANTAPIAAISNNNAIQGNGTPTPDDATGLFGANGPIFIDGPATPPKPAVIQIVVPAVNPAVTVEGGASYSRTIGVIDDSCSSPAAPLGATITVTNRDNGHSVVCVNNYPFPLLAPMVIVVSTKLYTRLGELVDAPLPVRLTW